MLRAVGRPNAELSIVLVNDSVIQELNAEYRGKDQPTDVLSFAIQEGDFAGINPDLLGDVVISVPTAQRQADVNNRPLIDEVTFLLSHGLLHLIGYDHQTDEQEEKMNAETARLMAVSLSPPGAATRSCGRVTH